MEILLAARRDLPEVSGRAFNIGGGIENTLRLPEMITIAGELNGRPMDLDFAEPRAGDQAWFAAVSSRSGHGSSNPAVGRPGRRCNRSGAAHECGRASSGA